MTYRFYWRGSGIADGAETIETAIAALEARLQWLRALLATGKAEVVEPGKGDYLILGTEDSEVATQFGFLEEAEDDDE